MQEKFKVVKKKQVEKREQPTIEKVEESHASSPVVPFYEVEEDEHVKQEDMTEAEDIDSSYTMNTDYPAAVQYSSYEGGYEGGASYQESGQLADFSPRGQYADYRYIQSCACLSNTCPL